MARRSPARLLAPLALVGFVVALLVVINGAGSDGGSSKTSGSGSKATATATPTRKEKARKQRKRYTVKAGDTPSGIAEKTGVPLSTILELNPDLDDQTLTVGDKIKLRR
jgi:LysM repeat protein